MDGLRSSRRVQIQQGDQRTRLPAVVCRSSARSSGNFGARPAREAGGNAVGQVHPKRCEAREAVLFHFAFWRMDLSYFGRGLLGSWPQVDAGVVLWSLSVCANDWQSAEKLTRLCTIPEPAMFSDTWDRTPYAMEAKILRPLLWFGLLEHRSEKLPSSRFGEHHFYRKTELFDRLLAFEVQVDLSEGARH